VRVKQGDEGTALFAFMNEIEHVAGITAEPIKAGDYQLVTGPQEIDDGRQFGAALPAAP
jgi:hypothetical protein